MFLGRFKGRLKDEPSFQDPLFYLRVPFVGWFNVVSLKGPKSGKVPLGKQGSHATY